MKDISNLEVKNIDQEILDYKSPLKVGQKNLTYLLESSREMNIIKPQADKFLKQAKQTQDNIANIQAKLETLYNQKIDLLSEKPRVYAYLKFHFLIQW